MKKEDSRCFRKVLRFVFENYPPESWDAFASFVQNIEIAEEICTGTDNTVMGLIWDNPRSILEIGGRYGRYTKAFAQNGAEVTVVEKDPDAQALNRIRNRTFSNITYNSSLPEFGQFDLIFLNGKDNQLSDYGFSTEMEAIAGLFPLLSENGALYLLHSIDSVYTACEEEKYINLFHGLEAEWDVWYPYPNTEIAPAFLYSRRRAPTSGELNCYTFFKPPQNGLPFSVEILELRKKSRNTREDYIKISCYRSEAFRIISILRFPGERNIFVKQAYSQASTAHIQAMEHTFQQLQQQFHGTKIEPNRILTTSDQAISFEYLDGVSDLASLLTRQIEAGEWDSAKETILSFAQLLRSRAQRKFYETPEFRQIFGSNYDFKGQYSFDYTDLDINFDNILLRDEKWVLIDYEFAFDFPIPVDFLIYRSIFYLFQHIESEHYEKSIELFQILCISENMGRFQIMEQRFQKYTYGDVLPLNQLLGEIIPNGGKPIQSIPSFLERHRSELEEKMRIVCKSTN